MLLNFPYLAPILYTTVFFAVKAHKGTSKNYTFRKPCVVKHRLNKGLNFQSTQKYGFLEVPIN